MRLSKAIEHLYLKVFVGIVVSSAKTEVVIELVKGSDVKERVSKSFETTGVSSEMAEFILPYLNESPFYYIALLNPMAEQGALPTCSGQKALEFADVSTALTLCQDKKWMVYASKMELDTLKSRYEKVGIDFIFSPFILLKQFFADKVDSGIALYVLIEEDALSVGAFLDGKLVFGEYLGMHKEDKGFGEEEEMDLGFDLDLEGFDEGIDLDDINAIDELEGIDDLNDIEDLDMIEEIEDMETFSEAPQPTESATQAAVEEEASETSLESFNKDYERFRLIQNALHRFYNDPKYDNQFIEAVYVADGCGVGNDLKNYLEEELFLKVYIRRIELTAEVIELAKYEAKHAV
jgi:hypothetical protein